MELWSATLWLRFRNLTEQGRTFATVDILEDLEYSTVKMHSCPLKDLKIVRNRITEMILETLECNHFSYILFVMAEKYLDSVVEFMHL
jgi:predicted hydrolase (HD superfamily)